MTTETLSTILRSPKTIAQRCNEEIDLSQIVWASIAAVALGAALFGASVGAFRGGWQMVFAAVKMPAALLLTLLIVAPAVSALRIESGVRSSIRSTLVLMMAAGARCSMALFAFAVPLWLAIDLGASYDLLRLFATLACAIAGAAGVSIMWYGVGLQHRGAFAAMLVVTAITAAQSTWILRPYLGDPKDQQVPFVVNRTEGGLGGALLKSFVVILIRSGQLTRFTYAVLRNPLVPMVAVAIVPYQMHPMAFGNYFSGVPDLVPLYFNTCAWWVLCQLNGPNSLGA